MNGQRVMMYIQCVPPSGTRLPWVLKYHDSVLPHSATDEAIRLSQSIRPHMTLAIRIICRIYSSRLHTHNARVSKLRVPPPGACCPTEPRMLAPTTSLLAMDVVATTVNLLLQVLFFAPEAAAPRARATVTAATGAPPRYAAEPVASLAAVAAVEGGSMCMRY
jgi:hypothetical protein